MPTYIAERYAGILTKEDVDQLFNSLTSKLHGNRSEAARQCGLTGKATYDWEKARYVKLTTKRKVLETCLRIDFLGTVGYLLKRSSERTVDVLRTILSSIYNEAIETNSKEQIILLLDKFNTLRTQYRGLINDRIMDEVADMLWMLRQKAQELEVPVPPKSIEDISAKELLEVLPLIGDMYLKNPQGAPAIAKTLNLPPQSIEMLLPTFAKLHPIGGPITEAETIPHINFIRPHAAIMLPIDAPTQYGVHPSSLRVKMRICEVCQDRAEIQRVATADNIHAWFTSAQAAGSPSDFSVDKLMTKRSRVG